MRVEASDVVRASRPPAAGARGPLPIEAQGELEDPGLLSRSGPRRRAICHPDRRHEAHGLCKSCYKRDYQLSSERKRAGCHPDRSVLARGLCQPCYMRAYQRSYQRGRRKRTVALPEDLFERVRRRVESSPRAGHRTVADFVRAAVVAQLLPKRRVLVADASGYPRKCACGVTIFSEPMERKHTAARPRCGDPMSRPARGPPPGVRPRACAVCHTEVLPKNVVALVTLEGPGRADRLVAHSDCAGTLERSGACAKIRCPRCGKLGPPRFTATPSVVVLRCVPCGRRFSIDEVRSQLGAIAGLSSDRAF